MTAETTERPGKGTEAEALFDEADRAFATGDFARVRALGKRLSQSGDPAVAKAGSELVRKTSADPVAVALVLASALFFALVVHRYF